MTIPWEQLREEIRTRDYRLPAWQNMERNLALHTLHAGPRDSAVEAMRFPSLVRCYREACPTDDIPPRQGEFEDWVLKRVLESHPVLPRRPELAAAIRGRAGRAFPSLVAQHHAELVLWDRFGAAAWDEDLDMRSGVDLVVICPGAVAVGLALRAGTARSREQAQRKPRRYEGLPFTVRELELEPRAYMAGPFWLYRPKVLELAVVGVLREHWDARARALEGAASEAYRTGQRRAKASRRDFMDGVNAALAALRAMTS